MSGQTRRGALLGGAAVVLVIAAGAAYELPKLTAPKFKGPYGDLVAKLSNPKQAAALGRAIPAVDADRFLASADALRQKLARTSLTSLIEQDSKRDALVEVKGWVLPLTLGELCVVTARTLQTA